VDLHRFAAVWAGYRERVDVIHCANRIKPGPSA
jgi:hypothetical protein